MSSEIRKKAKETYLALKKTFIIPNFKMNFQRAAKDSDACCGVAHPLEREGGTSTSQRIRALSPLCIEVTRITMARSNAQRCAAELQKTLDYIMGRSSDRPNGTPLSQVDEIDKILDAINNKLYQLPESGPGIIAVQHELPIDEAHARKITESFMPSRISTPRSPPLRWYSPWIPQKVFSHGASCF